MRFPYGTSIVFIFASEKNPSMWLSGDQNGNVAPSVPASGRALFALSSRTQS